MKPLSKSSKEAKKQTIDTKTLTKIKYSALDTRFHLSLHRLSYKSYEKWFQKWQSSKNQKFLKTNFYKSSKRHRISKCWSIRLQLLWLLMRLSDKTTKKQIQLETQISQTIFDITVF